MVVSRSHRRRAILALAVFVWSFVLPAIERHPVDAIAEAAAHGEPMLAVPHPVTQFEGVIPPLARDHCDLCHFGRALSGSLSLRSFRVVAPIRISLFARAAAAAPRAASTGDTPARAPPTSFLA